MTKKGDERFDWGSLVPQVIHPLKVAVIEALEWVQEPLSASDLSKIIDDERYRVPNVSYHMVKLAEVGAIEVVGECQRRGAVEKSYFFPPAK
jgi:hypothetical protein